MFTWIWVFLLYSWKIETLFLILEDQKLQTLQLSIGLKMHWKMQNISFFNVSEKVFWLYKH